MSNLNPMQFEPVERLLQMRSYEGQDYVGPGATVADRIAQIHDEGNERSANTLAYLRQNWDTARHVPVTTHPNNLLSDGHHRLAVAQERGETHFPVSRPLD